MQQRGLLVIGIQLAEVGHEAWIVQKAARQGHTLQLVCAVVFGHAVQRKHIAHRRFLAQANEHVVAEQQHIADTHKVARNAVVFGARTGAQQQALLGLAELAHPGLVQVAGLLQQQFALGLQALLEQLVAAAFGHQALGGIGPGRCAGRHGILFGHVGLSLWPLTNHCGSG